VGRAYEGGGRQKAGYHPQEHALFKRRAEVKFAFFEWRQEEGLMHTSSDVGRTNASMWQA
jgi:hypothetical protein